MTLQKVLRQQLLQPGVLRLQRLQALGIRHVHAAKLAAPEVVARFREAVPPAQIFEWYACVRFLQQPDDLLFAIPLLQLAFRLKLDEQRVDSCMPCELLEFVSERSETSVESGGQTDIWTDLLGLRWSLDGLNLVSAKTRKKELGFHLTP